MKSLQKFIATVFLFAVVATVNARQTSSQTPTPAWLKTAVFYQIYPQSFKDTNNDGIGDLQGIIDKLDYINWLGCNTIWINPCFESAYKDAGYDVIDYYKVGKRYGTNEDMKRLFDKAHKRHIRVLLDLVPGHTSIESSWFKSSQQKDRNEYTDRYIWTNDSTIKPKKFVSGHFERNGVFMKNFFDCQPALNYGFGKPDPNNLWEQPVTAEGPQKNKKEIMKIIDFWMSIGCDGFRVDMAPSLIKNDPGWVETDKFWNDIMKNMRKKYPEIVLLPEWGHPSESNKAGFPIDFIFQTSASGYQELFYNIKMKSRAMEDCYFDLNGKGDSQKFSDYLVSQLDAIRNSGYICVPTTNHDRQRPCCGPRNTVPQLKAVMTLLLTLPTVPLIYYGDEIGMKFQEEAPVKEGSVTVINRAGSRTPMQWNNGKNAGFSDCLPEKLYLPVDSSPNYPNVQSEKNDPESLLSFTRMMIQLKKSHDALKANGEIRFLSSGKEIYPLVYERKSDKETLIVVINPSNQHRQISIKNYGKSKHVKPIIQTISCKMSLEKEILKIESAPVSYGIYRVF
ncbi:alpha-amylase family glycosyl hydrolase [uncultured Bacteroides sp.]|uniref:alpha-amylase family glycosyl hydrolase n=1 Tax=uncultured Bacteroides sp. TaxID=162156 RepID=UPI002AAA9CEB|nr:alpha-amylase family glycosyl hydrolase [uncultured Bacteroides sp.]